MCPFLGNLAQLGEKPCPVTRKTVENGECLDGRVGHRMTLLGNVKRFRGGLVFKAHRLLYHSTLGVRVIKKKKSTLQARRLFEGGCFE